MCCVGTWSLSIRTSSSSECGRNGRDFEIVLSSITPSFATLHLDTLGRARELRQGLRERCASQRLVLETSSGLRTDKMGCRETRARCCTSRSSSHGVAIGTYNGSQCYGCSIYGGFHVPFHQGMRSARLCTRTSMARRHESRESCWCSHCSYLKTRKLRKDLPLLPSESSTFARSFQVARSIRISHSNREIHEMA